MDEYIKKEDIEQKIQDGLNNLVLGHDAIEVLGMIYVMPAADVAPVRHGRWIDKGEYAVCMECSGRSGTQYDGVEPRPLMTQFCPNCGAKMDGGVLTDGC